MPITELSLLLVLASGLAHSVWNLFAKKSEHKNVFLLAINIPTTVALLPLVIAEATAIPFNAQSVWLTALSMALQACYALLLVQTYKHGDLSKCIRSCADRRRCLFRCSAPFSCENLCRLPGGSASVACSSDLWSWGAG